MAPVDDGECVRNKLALKNNYLIEKNILWNLPLRNITMYGVVRCGSFLVWRLLDTLCNNGNHYAYCTGL